MNDRMEKLQETIDAFIKEKHELGFSWLGTFKNGSGQNVFAIYDPASGNPTVNDAVYLVSFLDRTGTLLPSRDMAVQHLFNERIIQVMFDQTVDSAKGFRSKLEKAFDLILEYVPEKRRIVTRPY